MSDRRGTTATPRSPGIRRATIVVLLVAALAGVIALKSVRRSEAPSAVASAVQAVGAGADAPLHAGATSRVRLVDLGADRCVPCKAMAPILEELRHEYAGVMQVDFIDVWKNPDAGDPYRIYSIPTQIFFDPTGRELYRHEGFISKADILAAWQRLGYPLRPGGLTE